MTLRSYTLNYRFGLINFDSRTWADEDDARWELLDSLLTSIADEVPITVATGSSNNFVATYSPAITAYEQGLILSFITNHAPTGAATLNVNGLGAQALKLNGADVASGDIPSDCYVRVIYDGTDFQIVAPTKPISGANRIVAGDSGADASTLADDFIVEMGTTGGMSLLNPNSTFSYFAFGRPSSSFAGGIYYDHNTDRLYLRAGETNTVYYGGGSLVSTAGFTGNLAGNVVGDVTGNADTASAWATTRTLSWTGDVTGSMNVDGSGNVTQALTIANDAVTNAKAANMATQTIKGRTSSGTGDPEDLTATQATAILNPVVGDSGSGGTKGLVPAPAAGDAKYPLMGDGTYKRRIGALAVGAITTTGVDSSTPTVANNLNVASVSNVVRSGSIAEVVVTFTTAMPDANYCILLSCNNTTAAGVSAAGLIWSDKTVNGFEIRWDATLPITGIDFVVI